MPREVGYRLQFQVRCDAFDGVANCVDVRKLCYFACLEVVPDMSVDLFSALLVNGDCLVLDDGIPDTSAQDVCQILITRVIGDA